MNAWKNVTRLLKHRRVSKQNLMESQSSYAVKRLIKKSRARTEMTEASRSAYYKFLEKRDLIYKRSCFRWLMTKYQRDKSLVQKLANMSASMDQKHLQSAFQMICNARR